MSAPPLIEGAADCFIGAYAWRDAYAGQATGSGGGARHKSLASRRRFCAAAVSSTSSFTPVASKTRFVRTGDVVHPVLHVRRCLRSARSGACSVHPSRAKHEYATHYDRWRISMIGGEFRKNPPQVLFNDRYTRAGSTPSSRRAE